MSLKPISAVYDHAARRDTCPRTGACRSWTTSRRGTSRTGTAHADLTAFVAAVAALPTQPGLIELGALLRKAAEKEKAG